MLIYTPAYDIYHCIYRMVFILNKLNTNQPIEIDRLKIIDFYMVFPSLIPEIKFSKEYTNLKKPFKEYNTKYRKVTNKYVTFQTMKPLQDQAISYLCLKGYVSYLNDEKIYPTPLIKSLDLPFRDIYFKYTKKDVEDKIFQFFLTIDFNGDNGLKARTNLMEYKYDKI